MKSILLLMSQYHWWSHSIQQDSDVVGQCLAAPQAPLPSYKQRFEEFRRLFRELPETERLIKGKFQRLLPNACDSNTDMIYFRKLFVLLLFSCELCSCQSLKGSKTSLRTNHDAKFTENCQWKCFLFFLASAKYNNIVIFYWPESLCSLISLQAASHLHWLKSPQTRVRDFMATSLCPCYTHHCVCFHVCKPFQLEWKTKILWS